MAQVNIMNVVVKDNPCPFQHPFQFEISFECSEDLTEDLEWKIIYVGSAESEEYDQTLDTVVVGPLIAGRHMFVFEAAPPDPQRIPREDVIGVTVVLLTCSYRRQEFIRVGYYVNNEYADQELKENLPSEPDFDKLQRNILATCPRVTRFKIDWGDGGDVCSFKCSNGFEPDKPGVFDGVWPVEEEEEEKRKQEEKKRREVEASNDSNQMMVD